MKETASLPISQSKESGKLSSDISDVELLLGSHHASLVLFWDFPSGMVKLPTTEALLSLHNTPGESVS